MPPAPRPARAAPCARPHAGQSHRCRPRPVNLGYHAHRYTQPLRAAGPVPHLAIAAEILREQHTPGEDWLLAIGRYHRPAGGHRGALPAQCASAPDPRARPRRSRSNPPGHHHAMNHRPHRRHRAAVHDHRLRPDRLRAADRRRRPRRRLRAAVLPAAESPAGSGRTAGPDASPRG